MPLFRFPGGKTKIKSQILSRIAALRRSEEEYGELFLGAGSILECMLTDNRFAFSLVRLNDRDAGIAAVWSAIIRYPEQLKEKLIAYTPAVADFDRFKAELLAVRGYVGSGPKMVELAAKKIILHQISFSGLGVMAGGPIGGRTQGSKYPVSCRYNPEGLCGKIDRLHNRLTRVRIVGNTCSSQDFSSFIRNANGNQIWYIDPPFYQPGPQLYQFGLTHQEHVNLAGILKASGTKFVLSYDDHPAIRKLYQWACIERIDGINYSIHTARQRAELLITRWTAKQPVHVGRVHLRTSRDLLAAAPSKSVGLVSCFTSEEGKFKMSTKTNGKVPPGNEPDLSKRSPLLVELETKVAKFLDTWIEAGEALEEIQRKKLYKKDLGFGTFQEYCRARWPFGSSRAYQLIAASKFWEEKLKPALSTTCRQTPPTEGVVRKIVRMPSACQDAVVPEIVKEATKSGRLNSKVINRALKKSGSWTPSSRPHIKKLKTTILTRSPAQRLEDPIYFAFANFLNTYAEEGRKDAIRYAARFYTKAEELMETGNGSDLFTQTMKAIGSPSPPPAINRLNCLRKSWKRERTTHRLYLT